MDRELACSTTTRIVPAWPPAVFTIPQAPGFEDWDPVVSGSSAIDGRKARWAGYAIGPCKRKCIEHVFGWSKTVGRLRQAMYRGRERVKQLFPLLTGPHERPLYL